VVSRQDSDAAPASRLRSAGLVLAAVALGLLSPPGRTLVQEAYWESAITAGLIRPDRYIGPHNWAVAVSPGGDSIAVGGMSRQVHLFDALTGEPRPPLMELDSWVMQVGWSPNGRWFAASSFLGEVRVIEVATGRNVARFSSGDVSYTFAFHPVLPLLASGSYDGTIRLVDLQTGAEERVIQASEGGVLFVTFTPDGGELVSTGEDGRLHFFDPSSGARGRVMGAHDGGVTAVAFSPDGALMATGGDDAFVRLWNVETGGLLQEHSPHRGWTNFTTFLPDGERWLTVGTDDRVHLWRVGKQSPPDALEGHPGGLMCVRAFPDGSAFVTSGKDGVVRIWDVNSLQIERSIDVWSMINPGGWRWPSP